MADKVNVIAIVFSLFVSLLCLFALFISFNHKIIIKEESLIIKLIRTVKINFREISEIKGNETFTNDNVIFIHTNERSYRINGFNSLLRQERKLLKTNEIIIELAERLNLIKRT